MTVATSSRHIRRPRRFAPLSPGITNEHNAPPLQGIVFDVDGTLCLPQTHMFKDMRAALSIPKSIDILEHIRSLAPHPAEQQRAVDAIKKIESEAMTEQRPQPGLSQLMAYLRKRNVKKAICTRNFLGPVDHLVETFLPEEWEDGEIKGFHPVITRETQGIRPKPSPEGLWEISATWGVVVDSDLPSNLKMLEGSEVEPETDHPLELAKRHLGAGLIFVGDSIDDMLAGYRAGAATVLLVNEGEDELRGHDYVDLEISRLDELVDVLEKGFVGRT